MEATSPKMTLLSSIEPVEPPDLKGRFQTELFWKGAYAMREAILTALKPESFDGGEDTFVVSRKLLNFCETAIAEAYLLRHHRRQTNPLHPDCLVNMCMEIEERNEAWSRHEELFVKGEFPAGYYELVELLTGRKWISQAKENPAQH